MRSDRDKNNEEEYAQQWDNKLLAGGGFCFHTSSLFRDDELM
jgi:hypothetical protein